MPGWDYLGHGYYFMASMVKNREYNLDKIVKTGNSASVILSDFWKNN